MAVCIPLASSVWCGSFTGLSAVNTGLTGVTDLASLDAYIALAVSFDPTQAGGFSNLMVNQYGCTGYNGQGTRFHLSAVCAELVDAGSKAGCNNDNPNNLCAKTLTMFINSFNAVAANTQICPAGLTAAGQAYETGFTSLTLNDNQGCISLQFQDSQGCGFGTAVEVAQYCAANPTDSCCTTPGVAAPTSNANATGAVPTGTTGPTALIAPTTAVATTAAASTSDGSIPLPVIIGAAAGGGALLLALLICCCCMKKKQKRKDTERMDNRYAKKDFGGKDYNNTYANQGQQQGEEVVSDYTPTNGDELNAVAGDYITIQNKFDDGWAYGTNNNTMEQGYFPLGILKNFAQDNRQSEFSGYNKRESSMRGDSVYQPTNGNDSMYFEQSIAAPNVPMPALEVAKVGSDEAIYPYNPTRDDEVPLRTGDRVMIKKSFDDGWCYGVNLNNQREGYFPWDCLSSYSSSNATKPAKVGSKVRTSSIYEDDGAVEVLYDYTMANPDEITLKVGDRVVIKQAYDDGWGYGLNTNTGKEGVFPLDCLAGQNGQQGGGRGSARVSSMYTATTSVYNTDSMYYAQSEY